MYPTIFPDELLTQIRGHASHADAPRTAVLGRVQGKLAALVAFGDPGHRLRAAVLGCYGPEGRGSFRAEGSGTSQSRTSANLAIAVAEIETNPVADHGRE